MATTYDRDVRADLAEIDDALDGRDNFVRATPHSSRHGLEGYDIHFAGDYAFSRTIDKFRALGYEIDAVALSSYIDEANFKIRIVPKNTEIKDLTG